MRSITRQLSVLGLVAVLWPASSWAQQSNVLDVGLDVGTVHDDERGASAQSGLLMSGYSSTLVGTAGYTRNRRRVSLSASMISALRYYRDADRVRPTSHIGGATLRFNLTRRAAVDISETAAYSPSYLYQLFPTVSPLDPNLPIAAAPDYRVDASSSIRRSTRVGANIPSPIGTLSLAVDRSETDFWGQNTALDMGTRAGSAGMGWRFGRRYGVRARYEYRTGRFGDEGESVDQRVQIGADYTRPLSSTRRATFSVSFAPSLYTPPDSATVTSVSSTPAVVDPASSPVNGAAGRYRFETSADVKAEITRNWSFNGGYRRGVDYVASLSEPLFNSGATLGATGSITKLLQVSASGGWANGGSITTIGSQRTVRLKSYTGALRLGLAMTRWMNAYGEYLYYYYDLSDQAILAPGLPTGLDRRTLRFGVTLAARPLGPRR